MMSNYKDVGGQSPPTMISTDCFVLCTDIMIHKYCSRQVKMVIPINERLLSGRKLYISQNGTGGPVIFWGMYPHRGK